MGGNNSENSRLTKCRKETTNEINKAFSWFSRNINTFAGLKSFLSYRKF